MPNIYFLPSTERTGSAVKSLGYALHQMRVAAKEDLLTCAEELDISYREIALLELGIAIDLDLDLLNKLISRLKRKTTEKQA